MSQEIKTFIRNISPSSFVNVEQELAMLCKVNGWRFANSHYIATERRDGSHEIAYILVREIDEDGKPMLGAVTTKSKKVTSD